MRIKPPLDPVRTLRSVRLNLIKEGFFSKGSPYFQSFASFRESTLNKAVIVVPSAQGRLSISVVGNSVEMTFETNDGSFSHTSSFAFNSKKRVKISRYAELTIRNAQNDIEWAMSRSHWI